MPDLATKEQVRAVIAELIARMIDEGRPSVTVADLRRILDWTYEEVSDA